ncbi:MAG: signal peptidase II [Bifidobacteriaceae bacterium]|jgi:signal peptidase II|nr:signal peptidase II [Bifidobacteriaceae bacterium]
MGIFWLIAVVGALIDQLSKHLIILYFSTSNASQVDSSVYSTDIEPIQIFANSSLDRSILSTQDGVDLIPGILRIKLVYNSGVSFSWLEGFWWLFIIVASIILVSIALIVAKVNLNLFEFLSSSIFTAGLLGNFADRLFRPDHTVVDFIQYFDWFIGNVADIFLVGSLLALIVYYLIKPKQLDKFTHLIPSQPQNQ